MNSPILSAAARWIAPVIFVVSLFLLYRGHNLPGGGFIGGLIAATALLLKDFASSRADDPGRDKPLPVLLMICGLGLSGLSAFLPVLFGDPFFTGYWLPSFSLPALGKVHLGTPLVFDVGVYLTVVGFVVQSARCLEAEDASPEEEGRKGEGSWS